MMKPISFCCQATLPVTPEAIARQFLDLANWSGFTGYGFIPGIERAVYEVRTADIVGSRIRVTNRDGSTHLEEIEVWDDGRRFQLTMRDFSLPLRRLASFFEECWELSKIPDGTLVRRTLRLYPSSLPAYGPLWVISFFLRKAVARHLCQLRQVPGEASPMSSKRAQQRIDELAGDEVSEPSLQINIKKQ